MARATLFRLVRSQSRTFSSAATSHRFAKVVPRFHPPTAKFNAHSPTVFASTRLQWDSSHVRYASQAAITEDDTKITIGPRKPKQQENQENDSAIVYYGPISSTIKKVKLLSLSTCCLSVSLGPVITFMTSPDMNMILKCAVASTVIILSTSTTAALHWFVSPYVHKLTWQPDSDTFEVQTMSWLARYSPKTIKFADIRPPETQRPFVSFKANGNFYFVDTEHCHNKALLAKLTPGK